MKTCVKCGSTDFNVSGKCRPCVVIANKAYRIKHREDLKARCREWYLANRLIVAERNAQNRKERAIYNAEYHAKNRDKINAYHSARSSPEANRIKSHNRRARRIEVGGKLSKGISDRLFKLQRGKCACGCKQPLGTDFHLDHRMPLALGGTNTDDNMQLLRKLCNLQKSRKHPVDYMQSKGFLI